MVVLFRVCCCLLDFFRLVVVAVGHGCGGGDGVLTSQILTGMCGSERRRGLRESNEEEDCLSYTWSLKSSVDDNRASL